MVNTPEQHHIWCNYYFIPVDECEMCKRLREKYPEDVPPKEMLEKYFPNVQEVRHG